MLALYDAGGPTYSLTVQKPGKVEIPLTKQDAFVITGQNDLFLFTHNAKPNALQLLWRINKVPMTSTLEIGSAVSWDRRSLKVSAANSSRTVEAQPTRRVITFHKRRGDRSWIGRRAFSRYWRSGMGAPFQRPSVTNALLCVRCRASLIAEATSPDALSRASRSQLR